MNSRLRLQPHRIFAHECEITEIAEKAHSCAGWDASAYAVGSVPTSEFSFERANVGSKDISLGSPLDMYVLFSDIFLSICNLESNIVPLFCHLTNTGKTSTIIDEVAMTQ